MFGSNLSLQLILSYVAIAILSRFIIDYSNRFIQTITEKTTHIHLGGVFVSGFYLGYDVDPDAMVVREIAGLTTIIDSLHVAFILTSLSILSIIEIAFALLYVWEERDKIGASSCGIVMVSGYLFPNSNKVAILLFLFGIALFAYSDETQF